MKVLAVLGSSEGIDTQSDRHYLEVLLGKNKAIWLEQPNRQQLNDCLWQDKWDIFFFAGHSSSHDDIGKIYLNQTESITVSELKFALRNAVQNGLKLAIFNSCDGLELARDLADLQIPHTIVMREPVPDEVAHKFLRYFLELFASGAPLYKAVKQAREKLQGLERDIPCASWLPVIYETPGSKPIIWHSRSQTKLIKALGAGILFILAIVVVNKIYIEKEINNRISSGEKVLVLTNTNPDKEKGAQAFAAGDCLTAKKHFQSSLKNNRNDPETVIYFNNALTCDRKNFKIVVSVPIGNNPDIAQEILRGVAQKQNEVNLNGGVNGRLIQVEIANDDNDKEIAQKLADEFIRDRDTLAVIGHNSSDVSVELCSKYDKGKLVAISPTSFSVRLTRCSPYVFRTVTNIRFSADLLSNYMLKQAKKNYSLVCKDSQAEDNRSFADEFRTALYLQGINLSKINCDLSNSNLNFEQILVEAQKSHVDSIVLAPHVNRIDRALAVAEANKNKLPLFASPTLYTSLTTRKGQQNVVGMVLPVPWHPTAIPGNDFPKKAEQMWGGKVTWRTAHAYDAMLAIAQALKTSDARDKLQQTLSNPQFEADGATGKIEFSSLGDRDGKPYLVQVQAKTNGTYDFVPSTDINIYPTPSESRN